MIKKKFLQQFVIVMLCLVPFYTLAQYNGNKWCFGDSAGIYFNGSSLTNFTTSVKNRGSCVSICDSNDSLLIYANTRASIFASNTTVVWNRFDSLVQNGDNIVGSGWYHELQLIPYSNNDSLVYLFSIGVTSDTQFGLYYSIINYKANNDSGIVLQKNIQMLPDPAIDGLSAIKHGNGKDWWLLFQKWGPTFQDSSNSFYVFKIDSLGLITQLIQNIGSYHVTNGGMLTFNSNGTRMAYVDLTGLVELYDFDRFTGTISNPIFLEPVRHGAAAPYYESCTFSPNGRFLYISSIIDVINLPSLLYQYDLNDTSIVASRQIIYQFNVPKMGLGEVKLAPNGKIYVGAAYEDANAGIPYVDTLHNYITDNLSVINSPDSLGAACDFQPFSYYLGGRRTYYGLPNNPDYTLGPLDTLTAVHEIKQQHTQNELKIFYHPQWDIAFLNADKLKGRRYTLLVYDITGKEIFKEQGNLQPPYFTKDLGMSGFAKGDVYYRT